MKSTQDQNGNYQKELKFILTALGFAVIGCITVWFQQPNILWSLWCIPSIIKNL